jgi:hypothetical protein
MKDSSGSNMGVDGDKCGPGTFVVDARLEGAGEVSLTGLAAFDRRTDAAWLSAASLMRRSRVCTRLSARNRTCDM